MHAYGHTWDANGNMHQLPAKPPLCTSCTCTPQPHPIPMPLAPAKHCTSLNWMCAIHTHDHAACTYAAAMNGTEAALVTADHHRSTCQSQADRHLHDRPKKLRHRGPLDCTHSPYNRPATARRQWAQSRLHYIVNAARFRGMLWTP